MKKITISESITIKESESFKSYLKEVSQIEMFESIDDEFECAEKAVNGDKKALEELIHRNLRFVISVAKQFKTPNTTLEDLVNEGNVGLIEAAKKYDPSKGIKFISYAVWWIRKEIMSYIYNNDRHVRIPNNKAISLNNLKSSISELEQRLGREVSTVDILDNVDGMTFGEIDSLLGDTNGRAFSIDKPINDDGNSMHDLIPSNEFSSTDGDMIFQEETDRFDSLLNVLDPKSKEIIKMYYGIGYLCPKNLNEIGEVMGVSRERIRQVKKTSIEKLRKVAKTRGILEFQL